MYDVAFVSNTGRIDRPYYDPSVRYRAFNPCQYLRNKGYASVAVSQVVFEANHCAFERVKLVVFHRPKFTESLARYVLTNKSRQTLVCDYDDLVFDVRATEFTPAVKDRNDDYADTARTLAGNAEMGALFDHVTVSTMPLLESARRCLNIKNGLVIHNGLSPTYIDIARSVRRLQKTKSKQFQLGYFCGTASHNIDFAMIAADIGSFLAESPTRKLLLVGPVDLPSELGRYDAQINRISVVSFYKMASLIAECEIVLGPLVLDAFSICKSGLKFFEAASLGVPVIATPIPDIQRFENSPLLTCASEDGWTRALFDTSLLENTTIEQAAEGVCEEASLSLQMITWLNHFGDILN